MKWRFILIYMLKISRLFSRLTPVQVLVGGFAFVILIGSILLSLPFATTSGEFNSYVDALFTAASATTTTGLIVVDTGTFYNLLGQIVILVLFQLGGLGYMVFIVLIVAGLRQRASLKTRVLFKEAMAGARLGETVNYARSVIIFTFIFELIGAVLLFFAFRNDFSTSKAIYHAIFHSVSAFCTAGFSTFATNFQAYQQNILAHFVLLFCLCGGIGFFVLYDGYQYVVNRIRGMRKPISLHSRLVITSVLLMMVISIVIVYFSQIGIGFGQKTNALVSIFQPISALTGTGFSTIDINEMSMIGIFILILLMYIGPGPGSTAGGIKITSFSLIILSVVNLFLGRSDVNLFKRRLPKKRIDKAYAIAICALILLIIDIMILSVTEHSSFLQIVFEVTSAFATAGLSLGITSSLSIVGKVVLSITMLIGRVGPLAIGLSLVGVAKPVTYRYSEEDVFVG